MFGFDNTLVRGAYNLSYISNGETFDVNLHESIGGRYNINKESQYAYFHGRVSNLNQRFHYVDM